MNYNKLTKLFLDFASNLKDTELSFGNTTKIVYEKIKSEISGKLLIFCTDKTFALHGKKIKANLALLGIDCSLITYPDNIELKAEIALKLIEENNFSIMLVVGESSIIDLAKYICTLTCKKLFALPIGVDITNIFCNYAKITLFDKTEKVACNKINLVIIDYDVYSKCKKSFLAGGYGKIISSAISCIDYRINCNLNKASFNKYAYKLISLSISFALNIKSFSDMHQGIMFAMLLLEGANSIIDIFSFGSQVAFAELAKIKNPDIISGVAMLNSFYVLLPLYHLAIDFDFDNLFLDNNINERIEKLNSLNYDCVKIINNDQNFNHNALSQFKKILYQDKHELLKQTQSMLDLLDTIKTNYKHIYNNKKPLVKFSNNDLKEITALASLTNEKINILTYLNAEGIFSLI